MPKSLQLAWIKERISKDEYLYTLHADEERRNDGLSIAEVEEALLQGQILENYPTDPRGPSCLVYGNAGGQPVHIVCGQNRSGWLVLITVYIPSPPKWETPIERSRA